MSTPPPAPLVTREASHRNDDNEPASSSLKWEMVERRLAECTGSLAGLPPPTSSIFVRPRKRVRLRKVAKGLVPVHQPARADGEASVNVEICVSVRDADGAVRAAEGGAARVEVGPCTAGELRACITALTRCAATTASTTALYAHMAAPNGKDWLLTEWAKKSLRLEVQLAKSLGVAGVVLGALTPHGSLDTDFLEKLAKWARPLKVYVCRHAFETAFAHDELATVDQTAALGLHGVYATFGHTAAQGKDPLARLARLANSRFNVVALGGLTVQNAHKLAIQTRVSHVVLGDAVTGPPPTPREGGRRTSSSTSDIAARPPRPSSPPVDVYARSFGGARASSRREIRGAQSSSP